MTFSASDDTFLFDTPDRLDESSDLTHDALRLAAIADRLANEDRTFVNHKSGRAENVAEHSLMLAFVAPALAERYYPDLDPNLVARFATVHDAVEAYVGDTPTHAISHKGLADKSKRERRGLEQLLCDYAEAGNFAKIVETYEKQIVPEARFVRVVDKLMPLLIHFCEGGETLRTYISASDMLVNSSEKAEDLRREYPEYGKLVDARTELALLASKHLY